MDELKTRKRRLVAFILTVAMLLNSFPVLPGDGVVHATDGDIEATLVTSDESIKTDTETITLEKEESGKYSIGPVTSSDGKNHIITWQVCGSSGGGTGSVAVVDSDYQAEVDTSFTGKWPYDGDNYILGIWDKTITIAFKNPDGTSITDGEGNPITVSCTRGVTSGKADTTAEIDVSGLSLPTSYGSMLTVSGWEFSASAAAENAGMSYSITYATYDSSTQKVTVNYDVCDGNMTLNATPVLEAVTVPDGKLLAELDFGNVLTLSDIDFWGSFEDSLRIENTTHYLLSPSQDESGAYTVTVPAAKESYGYEVSWLYQGEVYEGGDTVSFTPSVSETGIYVYQFEADLEGKEYRVTPNLNNERASFSSVDNFDEDDDGTLYFTVTYGSSYSSSRGYYGLPEAILVTDEGSADFDGWYTAATGGDKITNDDVVRITADTTIYAHWTGNYYLTTYGNELSEEDINNLNLEAVYSETGDLSGYRGIYAVGTGVTLPTIEKTGYDFKWIEVEDDISTTVTSITAEDLGNKYLDAQWTAKTYEVTLDANGGSITTETGSETTSSTEVTYAGTYGTLPEPTRSGYTFNGWYTAATGGTQITADITVVITAAQTLYAQWTANTYTVALDANGGSVTPSSITVTYDGKYSGLPTPTFTGHTFSGWYSDSSGTGDAYTASTAVTTASNHSLTAIWTIDSHNVITKYVDASGNSLASDKTQTVKYGADYTTSAETITGYTVGSTPSNASGKMGTSDITVTYTYTINSYTVTTKYVDASGNTLASDATQSVNYGDEYSTSAADVTGYTVGSTPSNASGTIETADITVTYTYEMVDYSIIYNLDGGTENSNPSNYNIGTETFVLKAPTREGYIFQGWTGSNGSDASFDVQIVKGTTGNLEYTAQWRKLCQVSIIFDLDGGSVSGAETLTFNQENEDDAGYTFTLPAEEPERADYFFDGWICSADNKTYEPGDSVTRAYNTFLTTETITFTANWVAVGTIDIVFNVGEGTFQTPDMSFRQSDMEDEGISFTMPEETPVREGYYFDGWINAATGVSYQPGLATFNLRYADTSYLQFNAAWLQYIGNGTAHLYDGVKYRFESGNWTVEGDDTVYFGDNSFYVPAENDYTLSES